MKLEQKIAQIITTSSLWNCGKDTHNSLSELTISLKDLFESQLAEEIHQCFTGISNALEEIKKENES